MKNKLFNVWLLESVKSSGYTRPYIADQIGCSKAALDKWLSGDNTPKVPHLLRLCHLLFDPEQAAMYYLYASNLLELKNVDRNIGSIDPGSTCSDGST